ncbi:MAG: hypothetical protein DIU68_004015 [Chloroflexota bacterium]
MSGSVLDRIQKLQFSDRPAAEALALSFIRETILPDAEQVELRPLAVSLNSFNGFVTLKKGRRLFFKTHTEPDNVIGEYYHAAALAEAGYPVLRPLYSSTEAGRQLLVYEVIDDPSVFDIAWAIETGDESLLDELTQAQNAADDQLMRIYEATLAAESAETHAQAPVHQLFYHRLAGGRFSRFYGPLPGESGDDVTMITPLGETSMAAVRQVQWEINGRVYAETLDSLIVCALDRLRPDQAGPAITGHGDAHNGNVFLRREGGRPWLMYFDPAFAGRHDPLLDLAKPLFHNVFAMWMYFPQVKRDATHIRVEDRGGLWRVEHDYALHPVREMFFRSKVERVLLPTLQLLREHGLLRADWRAYLKSALFCCPLLTMNLADSSRFPPEISLLGLAMAVEMGAESAGERSLLDQTLDDIEQALG